jgi:hypothetical protein
MAGIRELYLHSTVCFHGVNREDFTFSPILNPIRKQTFRPDLYRISHGYSYCSTVTSKMQ